jgi:hypothetical protein
LGPRVNPEFRAVLSITENVSAHGVRAHGVNSCVRTACVCQPHGMSQRLTVCLTQRACVRAQGIHAFTRRSYVRAHCVHTECDAVRAFTRCACVHAHCLRAHGVAVHPSSAVAVVQRSLFQRNHHMACARAHEVRECTRCACVHTACVRAHGTCVHAACVCAHGDHWCIHPAPSPLCEGRCYSATIVAACSDAATAIVCSSAGVYTGALVGPPCKPRLPRCATCHRDAAAVASSTLRPQSGPASTDAGTPCSCCNCIRDLATVIDPLCCRGAPALPPFCAAC